jgi:hypothetical protein
MSELFLAALTTRDVLTMLGAAALGVFLMVVVRLRRQSYRAHVHEASDQEVCEHLRPALDMLLSRGHRVTRVGQKHRDFPFEIHMQPAFSSQQVYDELKLAEPVFVSERDVLYCKEDWCEIHPKA